MIFGEFGSNFPWSLQNVGDAFRRPGIQEENVLPKVLPKSNASIETKLGPNTSGGLTPRDSEAEYSEVGENYNEIPRGQVIPFPTPSPFIPPKASLTTSAGGSTGSQPLPQLPPSLPPPSMQTSSGGGGATIRTSAGPSPSPSPSTYPGASPAIPQSDSYGSSPIAPGSESYSSSSPSYDTTSQEQGQEENDFQTDILTSEEAKQLLPKSTRILLWFKNNKRKLLLGLVVLAVGTGVYLRRKNKIRK